jgi:hypothetical protein
MYDARRRKSTPQIVKQTTSLQSYLLAKTENGFKHEGLERGGAGGGPNLNSEHVKHT